MRVILIQSDAALCSSTKLILQSCNIHFYSADTGEDGIDIARHYAHDLILLDLDTHDMKGLEVLHRLQAIRTPAPILVLSSDPSIEIKVRALELGADEYVTKPFHKDELIARVQALVRRSHGHSQSEITTGMVTVNLASKTVSANGKPVRLSKKEYQILELLSLRKGATLTKQIFIDHLYGDEDGPESRTIELFMCKLRKKLASATGGVKCIETMGHRGYLLVDPVLPPLVMAA